MNLINRLGINRTIGYIIITKVWGIFSGAITLFLLSRFLTPAEQGYYYTFSSILAFQVIFELGLGTVLTQFASHEMTHLKIVQNNELSGDLVAKSRLFSLVRLATKWYLIIISLVILTIAPIGMFFFTENVGYTEISWSIPWLLLVFFSSLSLFITPFIAIAEGCGFIGKIAKMRLYQSVFSGFIAWVCISSGYGLYATIAPSLGIIIIGIFWLYKNFLFIIIQSFDKKIKNYEKNNISWKHEILPMQWRIGLSWICGYFIFQLFNPVAFKYFGPEFAGKLGMSITVTNMMASLAMSWVTTKMPKFGNLIVLGNKKELNELFSKAYHQSIAILCLMILGGMCVFLTLDVFKVYLINRLLSPEQFFILCLTVLGNHIVFCHASYVRAHKIELYLAISMITAIFISITLFLVSNFKMQNYLIPGYFLVIWIYCVPHSTYLFNKFRLIVTNE